MEPIAIAADAKRAGFTGDNVAIAVAVALAESGGIPNRVSPVNKNGTIDRGLWQINSAHAKEFDISDWANPQSNANYAYKIYKSQGWTAWSTFNDGTYKQFLSIGKQAATDAEHSASTNPIPPIPAITNPLAIVGNALARFGSDLVTVLIALVLLVLGVIILMRKQGVAAAKIVGSVKP